MKRLKCGTNRVDSVSHYLPIQDSVEESQFVEVPCVTALPRDDLAALEFRIEKSDTALDLNNIFLSLRLQVLDENGKIISLKDPTDKKENQTVTEQAATVTKTKKARLLKDQPESSADDTVFVSTSNLLGYNLFSSAELFISDQKVTGNHDLYPWMTYVLNLLYQSSEAKRTYLTAAGWYKDDAGAFDEVDYEKDIGILNTGFVTRTSLVELSKVCDLYSKLMFDVIFPERVLPPQTDVGIRLVRSPPELSLLAKSGKYRIAIKSAKLHALKLKLTPSALVRYQQLLSNSGIAYESKRFDIRTYTMVKGLQNLDWVVFGGVMPDRLYIWQTTQSAYNGTIHKNPFNFQSFGVSKLQVMVNEKSMVYSQPIQYNSDNFNELYCTTLRNIGWKTPMEPYEFSNGFWVPVIDLTRDQSAGCDYVSPMTNGNLRLMIDYATPLNESIVVFCMGEFNKTLLLDKQKNPSWT